MIRASLVRQQREAERRVFSQLLTFREVGVRVPTRRQSVQALRVKRLHPRVVTHLAHLVKVLKPVVVQPCRVALVAAEQTKWCLVCALLPQQ